MEKKKRKGIIQVNSVPQGEVAIFAVILGICLNTWLVSAVASSEKNQGAAQQYFCCSKCTSINWQNEGQAVNFPAGALCTEKMNLLNKTLYPVAQYHLQPPTLPLFLFETRALTPL